MEPEEVEDNVDSDFDEIEQEYDRLKRMVSYIDESDFDNINEEIMYELIENVANKKLTKLYKNSNFLIELENKNASESEFRLNEIWKEPFQLFQLLLIESINLGEEINKVLRPKAAEENDLKFEAITRLHGNAVRIGNEILVLMRHGFADGAYARWRSLYEMVVIASFLYKNNNDISERFILHSHVQHYKKFKVYIENPDIYHEHQNLLGEALPSKEGLEKLKKNYDKLHEKYGDEYFKSDYGWAYPAINKKNKKSGIYLYDIEKEVGFNHIRPYYLMANDLIHATPQGMYFKIGSPDNNMILVGSSNYGMADPGLNSASFLLYINHILAEYTQISKYIIKSKVIAKLANDTKKSFIRIDKMMEGSLNS